MSNEQTSQQSIRSLFDDASALEQQLSTYPSSNSDEYQATLASALAKFQKCKSFITQASLFSLNEGLDDLASTNIRYLTVDFHIAELTLKARFEERKTALEVARTHFRQFITLCEAYELVPSEEKTALERAAEGAGSGSSLPQDPAARRTAKIAQFKREKELRAKIEALSRADDDDDLRVLYRAVVAHALLQTVQSLDALTLELEVLAHAPSAAELKQQRSHMQQQADDARRRGQTDEGYSERLDTIPAAIKGGALLSREGKPLRPFVLLDRRQQLKDGVFRPGHNLPTMTIDEYLEEERRRGGIIEGGGEQSGVRPVVDEDDVEAADRETMKAREWDEFIEQNPKGSGNTLNRG